MENTKKVTIRRVTKKRVWLTIADKNRIVKRLNNGEKQRDLAAIFGVSRATIANISHNRNQIIEREQFLSLQQGSVEKKKYTGQEEDYLEKIVFAWFVENRNRGSPMLGSSVQEFARTMNAKLGGSPDFKASNGWLHGFKKRHGIQQLSIQGEKFSADKSAADEFCDDFRELIKNEGYQYDNVYNADESGLHWKELPYKTLMSRKEKQAPGTENPEDRITLMVCANSTGSHRLPLFVIGKQKQPHCLLNVNPYPAFPVVYVNQKNGWMDKHLFMQWYSEVFIKNMHAKQRYHDEKFLLILDNSPAHPSEEELNNIDPHCRVKYLPLDVTFLIQPMDQGVIDALKKLYKKSFLREFLLTDIKKDENIIKFLKSWNLVKCFEKLSVAWENISESTLKHSWNNIFKNNVSNQWDKNEYQAEIEKLTSKRAFQKTFNRNAVENWFDNEKDDCGWETHSVDQIIKSVVETEDECLESKLNLIDVNDFMDLSNSYEEEITCREALESAHKLYSWYMRRCDNVELLKHLACIKEFVSCVTAEAELEKV